MGLKNIVRTGLKTLGLEIRRSQPRGVTCDVFRDMERLGAPGRVIFDVGANKGQSIVFFTQLFPNSQIHAFEPDPSAYAEAQTKCRSGVVLNKLALGDTAGEFEFNCYTGSNMSSFLAPGQETWDSVKNTEVVQVQRLDDYCKSVGVERIDILKIDAQGFDGAVLRGGAAMIEAKRIGLIRIELTFRDLYQGQEDPLTWLQWLNKRGYRIVSFYEQHHNGNTLGWVDALLIPIRP